MSDATDYGGQEQPEQPPEAYPPAPSIQRVRTEGDGVGSLSKIEMDVKYPPMTGGVPLTTTVTFRVSGEQAVLSSIGDNSKLRAQMPAIIIAVEELLDHDDIEEVLSIDRLWGRAQKFIAKCEQGERLRASEDQEEE